VAAAREADGRPDPAPLDVRLEVADGGARLHLSGSFTARTAGRVRAALQLVSVARASVVVDLAEVAEIDDVALDLLASARRAARREGWRLVLAGASPGPARRRRPRSGPRRPPRRAPSSRTARRSPPARRSAARARCAPPS
jgi:anti-anti-sigma regulatory factor